MAFNQGKSSKLAAHYCQHKRMLTAMFGALIDYINMHWLEACRDLVFDSVGNCLT
jgi:hypothetical protein